MVLMGTPWGPGSPGPPWHPKTNTEAKKSNTEAKKNNTEANKIRTEARKPIQKLKKMQRLKIPTQKLKNQYIS